MAIPAFDPYYKSQGQGQAFDPYSSNILSAGGTSVRTNQEPDKDYTPLLNPVIDYAGSNLVNLAKTGDLSLGNVPIGSIINTGLNVAGVGNPATNYMGTTLGTLGTQAIKGFGSITPAFGSLSVLSSLSTAMQPLSGWDAPGWVSSTLGNIPFLGPIIMGLVFGEKTTESPMKYYDPTTRDYAMGTIKGEPMDQFTDASTQWSAVKTNLDDLIVKQFANEYGIDPTKTTQSNQIWVPEAGGWISGGDQNMGYTPEVQNMISDVLEKKGGYETAFTPAEKYIYENYNNLFQKEQTTTGTGGPSPYMVYLAGLGA